MSILIANARVFAGQGLSAQETIGCFDRINAALAKLTGLDASVEAGPRALSAPVLIDLGLRPDIAAQLCARCSTVDVLLAADVGTLAEELGMSPLLLATVREDVSRQWVPARATPEVTTDTRGVVMPIEERRRVREASGKRPHELAGSDGDEAE
jgi:molecular chaperone HtpG